MLLEQFTVSHAPEAFRLWSDFETVKFTNWGYTPTLDACAERAGRVVAHYAKEPLHFGPFLVREDDGRFVGMTGADLVDQPRDVYDVWYIFCREEWGKGIAARALGELVRRMRASGRVRTITADVVSENANSRRLLERFGFMREGVVPGGFQRHGLNLDLCKYRLECISADPAPSQGLA